MERSKRLLLISHCIINQNTVVEPLARDQKRLFTKLFPYIEKGTGIIQLPCLEMKCLGLRRWGHVKEQFDNPYFKRQCRDMLAGVVEDIEEYLSNGYTIEGVAGIEGSPSCGCLKTCSSKEWKGSVGNPQHKNNVEIVDEMGVFMNVFRSLLLEKGIELDFFDLIRMED